MSTPNNNNAGDAQQSAPKSTFNAGAAPFTPGKPQPPPQQQYPPYAGAPQPQQRQNNPSFYSQQNQGYQPNPNTPYYSTNPQFSPQRGGPPRNNSHYQQPQHTHYTPNKSQSFHPQSQPRSFHPQQPAPGSSPSFTPQSPPPQQPQQQQPKSQLKTGSTPFVPLGAAASPLSLPTTTTTAATVAAVPPAQLPPPAAAVQAPIEPESKLTQAPEPTPETTTTKVVDPIPTPTPEEPKVVEKDVVKVEPEAKKEKKVEIVQDKVVEDKNAVAPIATPEIESTPTQQTETATDNEEPVLLPTPTEGDAASGKVPAEGPDIIAQAPAEKTPKAKKNPPAAPKQPEPSRTPGPNTIAISYPNLQFNYTVMKLRELRPPQEEWIMDTPVGFPEVPEGFTMQACLICAEFVPQQAGGAKGYGNNKNRNDKGGAKGDRLQPTSLSKNQSSASQYKGSNKLAATKVQMSASGYKVKTNHSADEKKMRAVQFILNKLSESNLTKLAAETRELELDRMDLFQQVITMLFEKAVTEPNFAPVYANFCAKLRDMASPVETNPELQEDDQPQQKPLTFPKMIVQEAQRTFEQNTFSAVPSSENLSEEELIAIQLSKRRYLGTMKFLGELYRAGLVREKHIIDAYNRLLANMQSEEALEAFCTLFLKTGKYMLDNHFRTQGTSPRSDGSFDETQVPKDILDIVKKLRIESKKNDIYAPRMRFMMMDVTDEFTKWISSSLDAQAAAAQQKKLNQEEEKKIQREKERKEKEKSDKDREKLGLSTSLSKAESQHKKGRGKNLQPTLSSAPSTRSGRDNRKGEKGAIASAPTDGKKKKKGGDDDGWQTGAKGTKMAKSNSTIASKPKQAQQKQAQKPKKVANKAGGEFAGFGDDDDEDEEEEEEEEQEEEEEEEEEEEQPELDRIPTEDDDIDSTPYFPSDEQNELLEVFDRKFTSAYDDYIGTGKDPEEVIYTFKTMTPENAWLAAYQAFATGTTRKTDQVNNMIKSEFFVHVPIGKDDWQKGFDQFLIKFSDLSEDKPILNTIVAQLLKTIKEKFPFDLAASEEQVKEALGFRYEGFVEEYNKA